MGRLFRIIFGGIVGAGIAIVAVPKAREELKRRLFGEGSYGETLKDQATSAAEAVKEKTSETVQTIAQQAASASQAVAEKTEQVAEVVKEKTADTPIGPVVGAAAAGAVAAAAGAAGAIGEKAQKVEEAVKEAAAPAEEGPSALTQGLPPTGEAPLAPHPGAASADVKPGQAPAEKADSSQLPSQDPQTPSMVEAREKLVQTEGGFSIQRPEDVDADIALESPAADPITSSQDLRLRIAETKAQVEAQLEKPFMVEEAPLEEVAEETQEDLPMQEAPAAETQAEEASLTPLAGAPMAPSEQAPATDPGTEDEAPAEPEKEAQIDQVEMRARIEKTRNRLKAKAFDAMMSGQGALLGSEKGSSSQQSKTPDIPVGKEVASTIEESLREEEDR